MLLAGYSLKVVSPECEREAVTVNAVATLSEDIGAVFPYLNRVLKGARYDPRGPSLVFRHEGHRIVLQSRQAAMTKLEDEVEAGRVMEWVVETINRTWEQRDGIEPDHKATRQPGPFEVYRLLPGGNCQLCGEPTCMAFSAKLLQEEVELSACSPLFTDEHAARQEKLQALLGIETEP